MKKPQVLILTGDGINCENETALAFSQAGGEPLITHINDLLKTPGLLGDSQILALPGGFSFGDDLGSGQILALKIKHGLNDQIRNFLDKKKPILGICNGFQALMKLGLLPLPEFEKQGALVENSQGHFLDKWVDCNISTNNNIWLRDLSALSMPIRHGEGNLKLSSKTQEVLKNNPSLAPLRYRYDVNGSFEQIAGLSDPAGLIFGLMPHPEAALYELNKSLTKKQRPFEIAGPMKIFRNAVEYCL